MFIYRGLVHSYDPISDGLDPISLVLHDGHTVSMHHVSAISGGCKSRVKEVIWSCNKARR